MYLITGSTGIRNNASGVQMQAGGETPEGPGTRQPSVATRNSSIAVSRMLSVTSGGRDSATTVAGDGEISDLICTLRTQLSMRSTLEPGGATAADGELDDVLKALQLSFSGVPVASGTEGSGLEGAGLSMLAEQGSSSGPGTLAMPGRSSFAARSFQQREGQSNGGSVHLAMADTFREPADSLAGQSTLALLQMLPEADSLAGQGTLGSLEPNSMLSEQDSLAGQSTLGLSQSVQPAESLAGQSTLGLSQSVQPADSLAGQSTLGLGTPAPSTSFCADITLKGGLGHLRDRSAPDASQSDRLGDASSLQLDFGPQRGSFDGQNTAGFGAFGPAEAQGSIAGQSTLDLMPSVMDSVVGQSTLGLAHSVQPAESIAGQSTLGLAQSVQPAESLAGQSTLDLAPAAAPQDSVAGQSTLGLMPSVMDSVAGQSALGLGRSSIRRASTLGWHPSLDVPEGVAGHSALDLPPSASTADRNSSASLREGLGALGLLQSRRSSGVSSRGSVPPQPSPRGSAARPSLLASVAEASEPEVSGADSLAGQSTLGLVQPVDSLAGQSTLGLAQSVQPADSLAGQSTLGLAQSVQPADSLAGQSTLGLAGDSATVARTKKPCEASAAAGSVASGLSALGEQASDVPSLSAGIAGAAGDESSAPSKRRADMLCGLIESMVEGRMPVATARSGGAAPQPPPQTSSFSVPAHLPPAAVDAAAAPAAAAGGADVAELQRQVERLQAQHAQLADALGGGVGGDTVATAAGSVRAEAVSMAEAAHSRGGRRERARPAGHLGCAPPLGATAASACAL